MREILATGQWLTLEAIAAAGDTDAATASALLRSLRAKGFTVYKKNEAGEVFSDGRKGAGPWRYTVRKPIEEAKE